MAVLGGGVGLAGLPRAETPSRASYGLTVACRAGESGSAADDGRANDAWLSQTVGARQADKPDSLARAKLKIPLERLIFQGDFFLTNRFKSAGEI